MTTQAQREAEAAAAGWVRHPDHTEEAREFTWRYPDLHLRVYALPSGVHCYAHIQWQGPDGKVVVREVARATWHPREVSEVLVVDWGRRALARWLEQQMGPAQEG